MSQYQVGQTFKEVGNKAGLDDKTLGRYVVYMETRWLDQETTQCAVGYAGEWAERFKKGIEYGASDTLGQLLLKSMKYGEDQDNGL